MTIRAHRFASAAARGLWPLVALGGLAIATGGPAYDPYKSFTQQRGAFLAKADQGCLRELGAAPPTVSVRGHTVAEDFALTDACFRRVQSFRPKPGLAITQANRQQ